MNNTEFLDVFEEELKLYFDLDYLECLSTHRKADQQLYSTYYCELLDTCSVPPSISRHMIIKELSPSEAVCYEQLQQQVHPHLERIYKVIKKENQAISISEFIERPSTLNYRPSKNTSYENRDLNLEEYIHFFGTLSYVDALYFLLQLCEGAAQLQLQHLTHYDLKPSNIMLTDQSAFLHPKVTPSKSDRESNWTASTIPYLKIVDFDTTRPPKEKNAAVTSLFGTKSYVAPEITDFQFPHDKADVYSLGCIFHFMLTGFSPKDSFDKSCLSRQALQIIDGCTETYPHRYSIRKLQQSVMNQLHFPRSLFERVLFQIPGFRTHRVWKMCIACYFYFAALLCLLLGKKELLKSDGYVFLLMLTEYVFVLDVFHLDRLSETYMTMKRQHPWIRYGLKLLLFLLIYMILAK